MTGIFDKRLFLDILSESEDGKILQDKRDKHTTNYLQGRSENDVKRELDKIFGVRRNNKWFPNLEKPKHRWESGIVLKSKYENVNGDSIGDIRAYMIKFLNENGADIS